MKKNLIFIFGIFLFLGFTSAHWGDDFYAHHDYMMGSYSYGMFNSGILSWVISLLIIAVLVLLIVWLVKKIQNEEKIARRSRKK